MPHAYFQSSNAMRDEILSTFMEEYASADPLDFDYFLSRGGSLIFTRFAVGMQVRRAQIKMQMSLSFPLE